MVLGASGDSRTRTVEHTVSLTLSQFLRSKLGVNEDRVGQSWHVIRSSGLDLTPGLPDAGEQIKRTIFMAECGCLAKALLVLGKDARLSAAPAAPEARYPLYAARDELGICVCLPHTHPQFPGRSLRNRPLPMVFSAFCAQEDRRIRNVLLLTMASVGTLCCGSRGPYFRSTYVCPILR